jgi:hypothetical protein
VRRLDVLIRVFPASSKRNLVVNVERFHWHRLKADATDPIVLPMDTQPVDLGDLPIKPTHPRMAADLTYTLPVLEALLAVRLELPRPVTTGIEVLDRLVLTTLRADLPSRR